MSKTNGWQASPQSFEIGIFGHKISTVSHDNLNVVRPSYATGENLSFGIGGFTTNEQRIEKRSQSFNHTFVYFNSTYGTHVAVASGIHPNDLVEKILHSKPYQPIQNSTLSKREDFAVEWVSYGYDNGNYDLAVEWNSYEGGSVDSYLEVKLQNDFAKYRDWKYCLSLVDTKMGEQINYDDIPGVGSGTGNALHGEIYFNTYGGIDGFCNDDHDGAQNR